MNLPIKPGIKPMLAKSAKKLPEGEQWRYEPKWDGFRMIVFRDGDDVYMQSRGLKPMQRYFPEIVEQIKGAKLDRFVLDGEVVVVVDGIQEFDLLSQRIHPAESRINRLAGETPAAFTAFDLLALDDESLLELPYAERRKRLEKLKLKPIQVSPSVSDPEDAAEWLTGNSEGVIAKLADSPYLPGERKAMTKIKRVRTADVVVVAFRYGKEENTVGSLILGLYDDDGKLRVVGHTSGFKAEEKRELIDFLEPYRTGERGSADPSRWKADKELEWEGLRPELVCEITFDHITGDRIRHGTKLLRWREDKPPEECKLDQLYA